MIYGRLAVYIYEVKSKETLLHSSSPHTLLSIPEQTDNLMLSSAKTPVSPLQAEIDRVLARQKQIFAEADGDTRYQCYTTCLRAYYQVDSCRP